MKSPQEQAEHPPTECCNYSAPITIPYPVMWNEFNKVVQCHNCGHVGFVEQHNCSKIAYERKSETKGMFCVMTALDWCIAFARTAKIWNYKV